MKLGYTIVYVPDVAASLRFYGQAFGLATRFLHESGDYGELDTGATTLACASHALGALNFPAGHVRASETAQPLGMEIGLVTDDVDAAHQRALAHGATELAPPARKPWGQVVSWLRAHDQAAFGTYRTRELVLAYMNLLAAGDTASVAAA